MTETQINHRAHLAPGEIRTYVVGVQRFTVMHVMNGGMAQASYREPGSPSVVLCTDRFAERAVRAYADAIEQAESDAIDALDEGGLCFTPSGAFIDGGATQQERDDAHAEALEMPANCGPKPDGGWICNPAECDRPSECILPDPEPCDECESNGQNCWAHGGRERVYGQPATPTVRGQDGTPDAAAMAESDVRSLVLDLRDDVKTLGETCAPAVPLTYRHAQDLIGRILALLQPKPTGGRPLAELLDAYGEAMARSGIALSYGRTAEPNLAAAEPHAVRADALKAEILGRFGGAR